MKLISIAEIKKTPCKKCGKLDFEQLYHAIVKDVGYIDEHGDFVSTGYDIIEITNGIELFECDSCGEEVEVKDEE